MKTILITGSTDGIGKLLAINIAKKGHHLLLHGRNPEKLEKTILEIKKLANNDKIVGFVSDLTNFQSVEKMISEISRKFHKIDVLINNAGVYNSIADRNHDNLDIRFAVNYFAPYLLTYGLLPLLENNAKSRIINLSSAAQATVSIEALKGITTLSSQAAYAQSKLAITMWSFYLSQKFADLNVIAVNPGSLLNTKMALEAYGQYWSSADKGADILFELALSEKHENSTGKYFDNDIGAFSEAHHDAYNQEKIDQLITETNKILSLNIS